jgi:CubicO group peptidase (beta-lactamase class C family)
MRLIPVLLICVSLSASSACAHSHVDRSSGSVEQIALDTICREAKKISADHLLILKNGTVLLDWSSGRYSEPYQLMSITKSIAALAIGPLFDLGKLNLDDRLGMFFPDLSGLPQENITIEQVLHHTSGLARSLPDGDIEDYVQAALHLPLEKDPGTEYLYNNAAVQLISGIIEQTTGKTLAVYAQENLFSALGIKDWTWDADKAGHTFVAAFLAMSPHDLGKIGQLIIQRGVWNGQQVISSKWIESLKKPSSVWPYYGLLWWRGIYDGYLDEYNSSEDATELFWTNGASNQVLVIVPRTGVVLILQTEDERRAENESKTQVTGIKSILKSFLDLMKLY